MWVAVSIGYRNATLLLTVAGCLHVVCVVSTLVIRLYDTSFCYVVQGGSPEGDHAAAFPPGLFPVKGPQTILFPLPPNHVQVMPLPLSTPWPLASSARFSDDEAIALALRSAKERDVSVVSPMPAQILVVILSWRCC